jgi:hypothetical protein
MSTSDEALHAFGDSKASTHRERIAPRFTSPWAEDNIAAVTGAVLARSRVMPAMNAVPS